MESLEVLINYRSADGSSRQKAVRVSASQGDTVADLKRRVAKAEDIPEHSAQLVIFNGQRLDDHDTLDKCGLTAADGSEDWADQAIYPNCWFLLAQRKAYGKVRDPLWPVVRSIRQPASSGWVVILAVFIFATSFLA